MTNARGLRLDREGKWSEVVDRELTTSWGIPIKTDRGTRCVVFARYSWVPSGDELEELYDFKKNPLKMMCFVSKCSDKIELGDEIAVFKDEEPVSMFSKSEEEDVEEFFKTSNGIIRCEERDSSGKSDKLMGGIVKSYARQAVIMNGYLYLCMRLTDEEAERAKLIRKYASDTSVEAIEKKLKAQKRCMYEMLDSDLWKLQKDMTDRALRADTNEINDWYELSEVEELREGRLLKQMFRNLKDTACSAVVQDNGTVELSVYESRDKKLKLDSEYSATAYFEEDAHECYLQVKRREGDSGGFRLDEKRLHGIVKLMIDAYMGYHELREE